MTETPTDPGTLPQPDPQPEPTPDPDARPEFGLTDAPDDRADDDGATGYAVFNRTTGQYVPGVHASRPSKSEASKAVPKGHTAAIVRV